MDQFSIPERLDPVARAENHGHNTLPSDRRARRQPANPPRSQSQAQDENNELSEDEEKARNLDELA